MGRRVEKPWGHEEIWAETERYVGKILHIERGCRLSLQFHRRKEETLRVLSGRVALELENELGELERLELGPGEVRHVPPGRRHRMSALDTCELVEVSTPELDDVVRLEDDYGREDPA